MTDQEFNLEDWWEETPEDQSLDDVVFGKDVESFIVATSAVPSTAWGDVGTVGSPLSFSEDEMLTILERTYKSFQKTQQADEWFYVIRRCSDRYNIREHLIASEEILYNSKVSTKIKHYSALPVNEIYFHILRAFARAEEGDFETAKILWNDIHTAWLHYLNDYRKPYVLVHLYLTSICSKEWEQSTRYLRQLWSIVKFMDGTKRHSLGVWDEWSTCLLVTWIFMKYSADFCRFFRSVYSGQVYPFTFQRKSIILKNLDVSFIADVIEQPYYELARKYDASLPEVHYEEKEVAKL